MPLDPFSSSRWQHMLEIVKASPPRSYTLAQKQFKKRALLRLLKVNIIVFLLQYAGLMITTLSSTPAILWFASGTACYLVFLRGYRVLPGIWLGSFLPYFVVNSGILLACSCATLLTLQAGLLVWLSSHFIAPIPLFYHRKLFIKFMLLSASVTLAISLGTIVVCYPFLNTTLTFFQLGLNWWLANLIGLLILSFTLTTIEAYFPQIALLKKLNFITVGIYFSLWLITIGALLYTTTPLLIMAWAAVTLVLLLIISRRFGWCGTVAALFVMGLSFGFASFFTVPLLVTTASFMHLIYLQLLFLTEIILSILVAISSPYKNLNVG